jgi:hypothetical protein
MVQILERVEAHYESREVPFGKVTLTAISTITTCQRCGADLGTFVHNIREREGRLPDKLTHPWFYDAKERAEQHQHDEADYSKDSPWRYNDITGTSKEE